MDGVMLNLALGLELAAEMRTPIQICSFRLDDIEGHHKVMILNV